MTYLPETIENIKKTLEAAANSSDNEVPLNELSDKINQVYCFIISRKNEELENLFCSLSLETIIALLQYDNEINKKVIRILEAYLQYKSINVIIDQYENFVVFGLKDQNPEIVTLTLKELINGLNKNDEVLYNKIALNFLLEIMDCLTSSDMTVTQLSSKLLVMLSENEKCLDLILEDEPVNHLCELCKNNEIVKFNIYDVIIAICAKSVASFQKCEKSKIFQNFVHEIDSPDILSKLNTIELYVKLLKNDNAFKFFEKSKIFEHLINILKEMTEENEKKDIEKQLMVHGIIKFIAQLADVRMANFESLQTQFGVLELLEKIYNDCDNSTKEIIITTVGNIGSTYEGLNILYHQNKLLFTIIDSYPTISGELKIALLQNLSCLLTICKLSEDVESMTQDIYNKVKGRPSFLKELIKIAGQIFEESRIAAYAVIKGIAVHEWGLKELDNSPEFINFITDRSLESSKLGQEWKYSIIQTLVDHPSSAKILRKDIQIKYKRFLQEGPYYKPIEPKVVIKGSS